MKKIIKLILWMISAAAILYVIALCFIYFKQEEFLFRPEVLTEDYIYQFEGEFEEVEIPVDTNISLNGLLFKAENPEGLIIFYHGNAGALDKWGGYASFYLQNNYNFFVYDYRGYGKSDGEIEKTGHLLNDALIIYDSISNIMNEKNPVIAGYSLGSGIAAYVASKKAANSLLLFAPYYSLRKTAIDAMPYFPGNILRYNIETANYLRNVECPVYVFHGLEDELIFPEQSEQLTDIPGTRVQRLTYENVSHNVFGHPRVNSDLENILDDIN
ncbi:alpha/beta hydrolase [Mangrovivirga cuniculi]|uniref:Alpha/beta hydrolase n=1 Tax=Mangrovivirga cuniculi TaxID=2715131 RepID=A0A4D7JDR9_9BACT|nr:alpha/beta hydrolase [Mangrovivirga cuniculi]QCK13821.1 alpha/beta hydrolase [Mangrovivirga cuniculi]